MDFKRMMKNSSRKAIRKARFSCVSTTAESVFGVGSTFFLLFYLALFQSPRSFLFGGGLLLYFLFTLTVNILLSLSDLSIFLRL